MYLKKFLLRFMLFLAILLNQSCSLLATTTVTQSKQKQVVHTPKQKQVVHTPKQGQVVHTPKQKQVVNTSKQGQVVHTPKQKQVVHTPKQGQVVHKPNQEQIVDTSKQEQMVMPHINQQYQKKVIVSVFSIVFNFLNILFFWKKTNILALVPFLFVCGYLFLNCFNYQKLPARTKNIQVEVFSIIEAVLLFASMVCGVLFGEPKTLFGMKRISKIDPPTLLMLVIPAIYIIWRTMKQYDYRYFLKEVKEVKKGKKSFIPILLCLALGIFLDLVIVLVNAISFNEMIKKNLIICLVLLSILVSMYPAKEEHKFFSKDILLSDNLYSIIELIIGLSIISYTTVALFEVAPFAFNWIFLKNAIVALLILLQKVPKKDKALNTNSKS